MSSPKNPKKKQPKQPAPGSCAKGSAGGKSLSPSKSETTDDDITATKSVTGQKSFKGSSDKGTSPNKDKKPIMPKSGSTSSTVRSTSQDSVMSHDQAVIKRTGSKDAGEGGEKDQPVTAAPKKPTTKAERRALQEAQRRAKAERQVASSKAGQVAREEKIAKETTKSGGDKRVVSVAGEDQKLLHHQMSSHSSRSGPSKSHDVPGLKQVQHFAHLPQYERKTHITNLLKDYQPPPCILRLGLQYSEELICGSNARCVAMLAAFKKVIQDYTTPPQKELRRDLDSFIKPHINFLAQCRPLSVSMGNAIKYLKLEISHTSPEILENEAKQQLCNKIDVYIRDQIELADKAISEYCGKVINDGDVILVHAYSSIVLCSLIDAHQSKKKFRVIVVDSRPKMEGRECLRKLVSRGIKCSYVFINAVSYIMKEVSKVIVGAHGLLANGYVMSRIGTSLIALVAKSYNVPVLVCCETYKFCDKVLTDAFVTNELGDPNDLVPIHRRQGDFLQDWKSIENLQLLNLVYDVTSPDLITMVITQLGNIPCTSVPVVLRISQGFEQMSSIQIA